MAQKPFKPTDEQREIAHAWTSFGIPQEAIARHLGIDAGTLRKHFVEELANGRHQANALVAQSLFQAAISGNDGPAMTAKIFWLKTRAGWRETQSIEITEKRSPEERRARIAAILGSIDKADE